MNRPLLSPVRIAVILSILVALAAFFLMREMESPWGGKLGKAIYGENPKELSGLRLYQGLIDVYTNVDHPARAKMKVEEWARIGLRLSSTLVLLVALGAAATARWWVPWVITPPDRVPTPSKPAKPAIPRWSWLALAAFMVLGAILRWPSATHYVTYDEQDNLRRNYHGFLDFMEPGKPPVWTEASMADAVWENSRVNNPFFFSALSQVSHKIWRAATGQPRERFDIIAMRMPSLVFGWLAIAAIWWAANTMGLVRAAPWAAGLMSVHALALHHSVEARGYGMCVFMVSILLGMCWRVITRGHPRDWALFGVIVFLSLFTYPGSLYHVATLNMTVAGILLFRWRKSGDASARLGLSRWVLVNSVAALCYLWLVAPAWPQAMNEFDEKFPRGNLNLAWGLGAWVTYASGLMPIYVADKFGPEWVGPSHVEWFFTHFPKFWPIMLLPVLVFPALLILGWRHVWMQNRTLTLLLTFAACSGLLMVTHHRLVTGYSLFHWYIIYILPAVLILEASGLAAMGDWWARRQAAGSTVADASPAVPATLATILLCWLIAIGHTWPGSKEWNDGITYFSRQPPKGPWGKTNDEIPRSEIPRGGSLWVTYRDGYLCRFRDHGKHAEAYEAARVRKSGEWGVSPLSPAR